MQAYTWWGSKSSIALRGCALCKQGCGWVGVRHRAMMATITRTARWWRGVRAAGPRMGLGDGAGPGPLLLPLPGLGLGHSAATPA